MQGHVYSANFGGVAVSAAQDLFEILAAAGVPVIIHSIRIGQSSDAGDAQAEMLRVQVSLVNAVVTGGSGGSTSTSRAHSPASPAASTTVEANNTTQATSSTTIDPIIEDTYNVQAGWLYLPTPEERLIVAAGTTLVVESPDTPTDPLTMSGTVTFEEIK